MDETEEDSTEKGKRGPWIGRIGTVKTDVLLKASNRFNSPYQITHDTFHRTRTNNPKMYTEPQNTQNCQSNSKGKEQCWRHNPPGLQLSAAKLHQSKPCGTGAGAGTDPCNGREPGSKPAHLPPVNPRQKRQDCTAEQGQSLQ